MASQLKRGFSAARQKHTRSCQVDRGARSAGDLARRARYIVPLDFVTVPSSTWLEPLSYTNRGRATIGLRRENQESTGKKGGFAKPARQLLNRRANLEVGPYRYSRLARFFWDGEGIEGVVDGDHEVLAAVEHVGHGRGEERAAHVEVPESLSGGGIECEEIVGRVGGEKKVAGGGEDSGDAFVFADFVIPDDFSGLVI